MLKACEDYQAPLEATGMYWFDQWERALGVVRNAWLIRPCRARDQMPV